MINTVALVSLSAGTIGEDFVKHEVNIGLKRLEQFGLNVKIMPHAMKGIEYVKNHPKERANDLLAAICDEEVDMILCAIGGDDTYRLLPYLFKNNELKEAIEKAEKRKIFLGFSDTTMNHLMLHKLGFGTFYGQSFLADVCEMEDDMLPYTKKFFEELIKTGNIKEIVPSDVWYEERTYAERVAREDGSCIDVAACARKDAPGIVAIYYYTSPEFLRNYTLTIQSLLNGYSTQKDGTIIVADEGIIVASNDESLLGQNTADNEVVKAMKRNTDSQHIYHLKNEGTGCYGIMLKQRDYYIYAYLPDTEVFHNLPFGVISVIFFYFLMFSIFWFWTYRTNLAHRKQEQEKDEKYKAELLIAAKKAEAANEAKTEFLQRMSHDIRTPINGIRGLVNMADHYADDMEKQTEYRTKVKEASNLLLELVNDVLDMSKLESGEIVLEEIPFNLSSISREVFVVIEQMAAEQNIRVAWEKKEITHRDFIGSPGYVKRVMMNILSNAVKYNKENGQIYVSCVEIPSEQPEMTTMEFVCWDTGIGMAEEFQKHIFEPFAQEYTGSRAKFAGTGLGMAISKKLVEEMGGTITFESKKGVGSTFVIRVPFKIDLDADKREESKDVSEKSIKGMHVLLAEDNELNMEIAEFLLQNEGAEVTKAWNGQEIVELFRKSEAGEFDVILMDIMMPIINGYEAAKRIRSLDREDAKKIPIIAMTANAFTEDRIRAKEAGMDEHVAKPIDVELLIKVIHKLVKHN